MRLTRWIRGHELWVIGLIAIATRTLFVLMTRADPMAGVDSAEYDELAKALLAGNGITTTVGFVRPPLYPVYLAACYALGGVGVMQVTQVVFGGFTAVAIGVLARELFSDDRAGWAGGLIAAFYPWFLQYVGTIASETLFTFLAVVSFIAILRASKARSRWAAIGAGALFGVASLARANLLMLAPGLALWWWWQGRRFVPAFLFGIGIIAALFPFAAYNAAAGRGLVVGSSGGGISFYAGNNPDTARFYGGQLSDEEWRTLSQSVVIGPDALRFAGCDPAAGQRACIANVPIAQADVFWYSAGFRYIRTDPGTWAVTEVRKFLHYWRPWVEPRVYSLPVVIVSGVSFGGLLLLTVVGLRRLGRREVLFVLAVAFGSTIAAVAWNVQLRYRFALLDPALIAASSLPTALLLHRIWSAATARRADRARARAST